MDERALGNKFAAECARALPQSARVACDASAHQQPAGCMGGRSGDMHADGSHAPSWPEAMPGRGGGQSHCISPFRRNEPENPE